jgi:sterol desaturase/sphingolipid hydroxylase (fatty acid hydroxylase superfamily)
MSIILYAIPAFLLLIAIELVAEKVKKTNYYRLNDAITSLSIGGMSRVIGVLKNAVPFTIYILIFEHLAIFSISTSAWMWIGVFVLYDFFYYWNHRFGHEISLFWAAHVVHHSSEDYNLSTALRQTSGSFFNFVFFLPLALLGVDPVMLITVGSINLVYQFWVHTQHVGKLGVFEWIFVTPSNHRVHHAQNQIYLDKNYGGVFIIWDRLFGSFQEELNDEKPIYGVRKALNSWNPFYANIQVYKQLIQDSLYTKSWKDKCKVWLGRTGWRPEDVSKRFPLAKTDLASFTPYQTQISALTKCYALLQYILITALVIYLMLNVSQLSLYEQGVIGVVIIFASINLAWIMEAKHTALYLEWLKLGLLGGLLYLIAWLNVASVLFILACTALLIILHRQNAPQTTS